MNKFLTPTYILRYIERRMGYGFNELELDPNDILETIRMDSLPEFSKFFPYIIDHLIMPDDCKVPGYENRYYLRVDNRYTVLGVAEVFLSNTYYGDIAGLGYSSAVSVNGNEAQLIQDILSANRVPVTFRYYDEDQSITIMPHGITNTDILTRVKVIHLDDFSSIPLNMRDEFLKLALYDVQMAIYPIRRRFSNLQTAYGNIELFVDELAEAEQKRTELLENWRRHFIKAPNRKKIFIY